MIRHNRLVYGVLAVACAAMLLWQTVEHSRFREASRETLIFRGRDITTTLGLVIRSQRRFGAFVNQERLEPALKELVKADQVLSVSLLNVAGEVVATAGAPVDVNRKAIERTGQWWDEHSVTLINLVDLEPNTNVVQEGQPIIVLPRRDPSAGTNDPRNPPRFGGWRPPGGPRGTNASPEAPGPAPEGGDGGRPPGPRGPEASNRDSASASPASGPGGAGPGPGFGPPPDAGRTNGPGGRPFMRRPPWMSEEEYASLTKKQGVHSFVVVLSTRSVYAAVARDLWMRALIVGFGALAAVGMGAAWRNVAKFSDLELRLLRASEMNHHLREMNIAAAGLAHETRNPLNIIRGLAQMISRQSDAAPEIRAKTRDITDEVDRVTAQLNEFINYSKPREVRLTPVSLDAVIADVTRALECDLDEKKVRLEREPCGLRIQADEQLLRQTLFNLMLNAIQAVDEGGWVKVAATVDEHKAACLEVMDNGPGVAVDQREEIFKPYFTTHQKGTGLGLAVVKQIVLAHGWEIQFEPNQPRGAIFRLNLLKAVA